MNECIGEPEVPLEELTEERKIGMSAVEAGPDRVVLWRRLDPIRNGPWQMERPKGGVVQHENFVRESVLNPPTESEQGDG